MEHVILEPLVAFQHIANETAKEENVSTGAERRPDIGASGCSSEARIDMDDLASALAGLDDPLESDGVLLGHRRAHNQNCVGVGQRLLSSGSAAASN